MMLPKLLDLAKPKISFKTFKNKHKCVCVKRVIYSFRMWICEMNSNYIMRVIEKLRTGNVFAANDTPSKQAWAGEAHKHGWVLAHSTLLLCKWVCCILTWELGMLKANFQFTMDLAPLFIWTLMWSLLERQALNTNVLGMIEAKKTYKKPKN